MMQALDNKCPVCGAMVMFNPTNQMWDCAYCSSKFTLEEMQRSINPEPMQQEANLVGQLLPEDTIGDVDLCCCKNCGAEIMAEQTTTVTFCVYCGSTAIIKHRINEGKTPDYIIPFRKVKKDAIDAFKQFTKVRPLTPKCFKNSKNIERIMGVYIPFWAYDLSANGEVEFEASNVKTWSDAKYKYTKTDKYLVRKAGHFDFDKVLADASSNLPDGLIDSLEPFNYDDLQVYNHTYLSGFLVDKYDIDGEEGLEKVVDRTNSTVVNLIDGTINHQRKKVIYNGIRITTKNIYYIMLPVWLLNIRYKNKNYTFAINGQTGKLVGNVPIDILRTILWSFFVFIILFVVGMFLF